MSKRGVVLFAHNTNKINYYEMAVYTANRVNRFLDLPVTIITDSDSWTESSHNSIFIAPDKGNSRNRSEWFNKGRFQVYDLSPYDETLMIDTDYLINSNQLLKTFDYPSDLVCHRNPKFIFETTLPETVGNGPRSAWATVMRFSKTDRARCVFNMMQMIQENYSHYSNIYRFMPYSYRNDYSLTLALRTVNGQVECPEDYLSWPLLHIGLETVVEKISDTSYKISRTQKDKTTYIILDNTDFHMLNKKNFAELM